MIFTETEFLIVSATTAVNKVSTESSVPSFHHQLPKETTGSPQQGTATLRHYPQVSV